MEGEVSKTAKFQKIKARKEKEKISMEKYMDFVLSHKQLHLKLDFLNQIVAMHGFKRINKAPKSVLSDAVQTLDLMHPSRSTLEEDISSCASITLNHIMADLNDLAWQECCVTSVAILSSDTFGASNSSASASSYYGFEIAADEGPMKWLSKRKRSSAFT